MLLHEFLSNVGHNLFKPLLLFFYFGFMLPLLKVDFEFPDVIYQGLTMYLLLAIGWHGGEELAAIHASSIGQIAGFMVVGFVLNFAIGMAAYGLRPVVEIQFADYIYPAYDQIVSEAAKMRYRSGGQFTSPLTIRSPYGGGIFGGQTHSQSPESLFTHISGLKVVIPSNPLDAKGLLTSAIEDDDPVIFFEPKRLYNGPFDGWHEKPVSPWKAQELAQVPTAKHLEPIGKARVMKEGGDVTILAYGTMVP